MSHQIHLIRTGSASSNVCSAGVPTPLGITKLWTDKKIRVVDATLPKIPIIFELPGAVVSGGATFDMPVIYTMSGLVNFFDGLTVGGVRIAYAFYSNNEFELCTTAALTLAPFLAGFLKYPTSVAQNTCLSSHVDVAEWPSMYTGYSIQLVGSGVRGITTDLTTFENHQTVAVLGPTADCSQTPWLKFENTPTSFYASVYFINVDGTVGPLAVPLADVDTFEVVIEVT